MSVPNTFSLATGSIPLSQLDANFAYYDAAFQITGSAMSLTGAVTLSAGTANGIPYLNGSKVLTSGSALTFDGTNLGVGLTPFSFGSYAGISVGGAAGGALSFGTGGAEAGRITGQSGYLNFYGGTVGALSELMRLTSTGLGIGTSSPGYKLDVNGYGRFSSGMIGAGGLTMYGDASSATGLLLNTSGNLGLGVTPSAWASGYKAINIGSFSAIADDSVNDGALSLLSNAYGDTSTSWKYRSALSSGAGLYKIVGNTHKWYTAPSGTAGNAISFTQAMTLSASSELNIDSGTGGGRLTFTPGAANNTISSTTTGFGAYNILRYRGTQHQWLDSAGTQALTLDASGNHLLGTTSKTGFQSGIVGQVDAGGTGVYARQLIGHSNGTGSGEAYAQYLYNATVIGSITQNGTTGVLYNMVSDHRLKTVIGSITDSGARIDALEPIEYEWKSDGSCTRGFLAHKFQEVYAGSVTGTKDAVDKDGKPVYQAMQAGSSEVIADLVAEIQSLRKRLAALESK